MLWSQAAIVEAVKDEGLVKQISRRSVGSILAAADLKPHRVKMWCHSKDPLFKEKMQAIVDLYVDSPVDEPVLCIDEKTGMQALSRAREIQTSGPGKPGRFDFEYKRNGTRCLFACFDVGTGEVLGRCTTTRTRDDFQEFMDEVARRYPQGRVHVVLDNLNTHHDTKKVAHISDWNERHGNRFVFHYTPTHGSWLNQVELWFGILTRRVLRYGNFSSPDDLVARVNAFIDQWNEREAHPFRWTYTGEPLRA